MNEDSNNSKKKIKILIAVIAFILVTALVVVLFRSCITATTMRILRLEGEVTLEDNGKPKTVTENLRLKSGNALATAIQSLVSIGLDDTKIVTLDEKSRAIFEQRGRKLQLKLTDGSLFFEVSKPLTDEETFDISTSTMVVGIRGTSGWVSVDGEHEQLIITDGIVHVIGTNPVTGEVKEIDVKAGQRITVYLYNDRNVDSIMFVLEDITERELPEFLLERLRENRELLDKVCRETGWDKPWILGQVKDEMPVIPINDETPNDNGPDDDNDGGGALPEVTEPEEEAEEHESDIDPEHPEGARWSERRAARAQIIFTDVNTGIVALKDGTLFDPVFYAVTNPDVVAKYGTDTDALLAHWLKRGKREGRPPIAPPTPTPTPIWVMQPVVVEEDDDHDHEDNRPKSSTNTVRNTVTIDPAHPDQGTITFTSGVGANATYSSPGAAGGQWNLSITSPDSGNNTTVTLPNSFNVDDQYNGSKSYGISIDPTSTNQPINISLAGNNPAMQNVNTLDLSAATSTTGGNVYGRDMITFMNNNAQLDTLKGPASTLTRNPGTATNSYSASVNYGLGAAYQQTLNDLSAYLSNNATGLVTSTTFAPNPNLQNGQTLNVTYDANNTTSTTNIGNTTYYDIEVDNPFNTPAKLMGATTVGGVKSEIGTLTSDGLTVP